MDKKFLIPKITKNAALPVANQLARQLSWLIADGVIKPGEKLPTIREYAQELNIHHHTVRAAYHLLGERAIVDINPGVGTVVKGYFPFTHEAVNSYLDQRMIGIFVPSLADFYQQIFSGIENIARKNHLIPFVLSCHEDPIFAEAMYKTLTARGITGFINISQGFSDAFYKDFSLAKNLNVPLVFLDVVDAQSHSIIIDTPAAIGLAVDHMLGHGYRDITLVNCPSDWPVGREALKGFHHALEIRGVSPQSSNVYTVPNFGYDAGRFVIERMLKMQTLPRGLVTVSDNLAIGAISALKDHSIKVPEDVAVIGFNDIATATIVDPPLSTISLPLFEMGQYAMLSLVKILEDEVDEWISKKFSGQLATRASCGCEIQSDN